MTKEKIYFIGPKDRSMVKIGRSENPKKRLATLQSGSPAPLQILAEAPGCVLDEKALHAKFLSHHSHGEWFRGHSEILALIAVIAVANEIPSEYRGDPDKRYELPTKGNSKKRTPQQIKNSVEAIKRSSARQAALRMSYAVGQHPGHA